MPPTLALPTKSKEYQSAGRSQARTCPLICMLPFPQPSAIQEYATGVQAHATTIQVVVHLLVYLCSNIRQHECLHPEDNCKANNFIQKKPWDGVFEVLFLLYKRALSFKKTGASFKIYGLSFKSQLHLRSSLYLYGSS